MAVSVDTFLVVLTDNTYQYRKARTNEILLTGAMPKDFVPCQYIRPLINFTEPLIYFVDSVGTICRLDYKQNTVEMRRAVIPKEISTLGSTCI